MAPRRWKVRELGTFDVSVPSPPLPTLAPAVDPNFVQFPHVGPHLFVGQPAAIPDYLSGHSSYTSAYSADQSFDYSPNSQGHSHKRRRLEGFNQMPSIDESSSAGMGYQEKLPIADQHDHEQNDDATSLVPRYMPNEQSLGSPWARMAESLYTCCSFGWQQPTGYQPVPGPATVVYDPPQQFTMEAVPPMPDQIQPLQHLVPSTEGLAQPAVLANDQLIASDQLNMNSLPLDGYPVLTQPPLQPSLQPMLQEPSLIDNMGGDPYLLDQPVNEYPTELASSELYNVPMVPALIPMPSIGDNPADEDTSPLQYGPAPLPPPIHPPLVDIEEATPSEMYHGYHVPPMQNVPHSAVFEDENIAVGQRQEISVHYSPPPQRSSKRGPFRDNALREQTARTRRMGSCIRCRMQRIRCEFNEDVPGGWCLTCKKVENTKATRLPCLRYKITDMVLYKPGQVPGYEWSQRWAKSISDPIHMWASNETRLIYISVSFSDRYLPLEVRKFVPQEGDKLERTWDYKGTKKSVAIPPYALVDLDAGKSAYTKYIRDSMTDIFRNMLGDNDNILYKTYLQAWHMWRDPSTPTESFDLLNWTLRLWIAVRLSTTSAFIAGKETLGMSTDILDQTSPNPGKIPLPPVLGAQMDMILIQHIQNKLRHELLDNLQKVMLKNKQSSWLVTYLVSFILLHNVALITKHDAAYARKHGMKRRFAREDKVQEYHIGANIILAHFHYCNKGVLPFSEECEDHDLRALAHLDEDKIKFVRATRAYIQRHKEDWKQIHADGACEEDFYFISQLYDENWKPRSVAL